LIPSIKLKFQNSALKLLKIMQKKSITQNIHAKQWIAKHAKEQKNNLKEKISQSIETDPDVTYRIEVVDKGISIAIKIYSTYSQR
jgi:hypothetical protein